MSLGLVLFGFVTGNMIKRSLRIQQFLSFDQDLESTVCLCIIAILAFQEFLIIFLDALSSREKKTWYFSNILISLQNLQQSFYSKLAEKELIKTLIKILLKMLS